MSGIWHSILFFVVNWKLVYTFIYCSKKQKKSKVTVCLDEKEKISYNKF